MQDIQQIMPVNEKNLVLFVKHFAFQSWKLHLSKNGEKLKLVRRNNIIQEIQMIKN